MGKKINIISVMALLVIGTILLLLPNSGKAQMRNVNKVLAGTPPFDIVKKILASNEQLVSKKPKKAARFAPYITWLTDPDAKIQPSLIMSNPDNNIYTSRNLGAQVELATGPLDYGIRHLHTPILLITLNSDNQAIKFFMAGYKEFSPSISRELDHLHLALAHKTSKSKKKFPERLLDNIEANIDYQVLRAVNRYQDRIKLGRLDIVGSIADYENSYNRGRGRLIIINVNGEKDVTKLRNLAIMKSINPNLQKLAIGRHRPKSGKN